jgi:hypothetical protein
VGGGANFIGGRWEFPESVGGVDASVGDATGVLRGVGVTEIVGAVGVVWEVGGEEGAIKRGLGVVEESLLLDGRNWLCVSRNWKDLLENLAYQC